MHLMYLMKTETEYLPQIHIKLQNTSKDTVSLNCDLCLDISSAYSKIHCTKWWIAIRICVMVSQPGSNNQHCL